MADLSGKTIAFLVATEGIEQVELTEPWKAVEEAGATPELVSPERGQIQGKNGTGMSVDRSVDEVDAAQYDGLVLPGGVMNPDKLRMDDDAVGFVRSFVESGKPVGAICHGPWTLVEAGVVDGMKVTSYPSLQTDLRNAGADWVDEECVVDRGLVTSRRPDDLPAFCSKIVEEFCEGKHEELAEAAGRA